MCKLVDKQHILLVVEASFYVGISIFALNVMLWQQSGSASVACSRDLAVPSSDGYFSTCAACNLCGYACAQCVAADESLPGDLSLRIADECTPTYGPEVDMVWVLGLTPDPPVAANTTSAPATTTTEPVAPEVVIYFGVFDLEPHHTTCDPDLDVISLGAVGSESGSQTSVAVADGSHPDGGCCDYVAVRAGTGPADPVVAVLCGSDRPDPIRVPGYHARVEFHSDSAVQGKGFAATFATRNSGPLPIPTAQFPDLWECT